ncbi:hypothetical protein [Streptomyces sp. NPDC054842]
MFKRIFRRRRSASASPLRRVLHGTAVSLSSAALGYGTTFIPGVDAPGAAGLGLGALPVVLAFFPVPPRDGSDTTVEHQESRSDAHSTDPEQPAEDDLIPSDLSTHAAAQDAADTAGSPCDTAGTAGLGDTPPGDPAPPQPDEDIVVWEPRFEIRPRVTVHPVTFEQAAQAGSSTPPADPGEPRVEPGKAS